jgi:hypothetical protein
MVKAGIYKTWYGRYLGRVAYLKAIRDFLSQVFEAKAHLHLELL